MAQLLLFVGIPLADDFGGIMSFQSIIPVGDGEYVSDAFVVESPWSIAVLVYDRNSAYHKAIISMQISDKDGGWWTVADLTPQHPAYVIPGVGEYRMVRRDDALGVGSIINIYDGSSGGGGDASAANQLTAINRIDQSNSYLLDISGRVATAALQSAGNTTLTDMQGNTSTIAGRIAPISATTARKVAITSTATSIALSTSARYIDFRAVGTDAYYVLSTGSPVATADSHYIGQDERLMRGVVQGTSISVLSASGDSGMLYITER